MVFAIEPIRSSKSLPFFGSVYGFCKWIELGSTSRNATRRRVEVGIQVSTHGTYSNVKLNLAGCQWRPGLVMEILGCVLRPVFGNVLSRENELYMNR